MTWNDLGVKKAQINIFCQICIFYKVSSFVISWESEEVFYLNYEQFLEFFF